MHVEELNTRWEAAAPRRIAAEMTFDGEFLILGAQTCLAKVGADLDEARLAALLSAAHGRPIAALSPRRIQRALEKKRDGDPILALVHLALSGAAKLRHPREDAYRLFLADALITEGVDPSLIIKGLGLDLPFDEGLRKYSPDQPRVPAGNPDGGQWTSADWEGSSGSLPRRTSGVQVADASATRGHETTTDAGPATAASAPTASGTADTNGKPFEVAQDDLDQTCSAFIAANCKASILRVFPGQYLNCTLREVQAAAKAGDAAAKSACKLLNRGKYRN
jgi:hypothetical protein